MDNIKDKKYNWPNINMADGSGDCTHSSKLIALSIRTLGEIIKDLAILIQEQNEKSNNDN
jgi:hypothetical protein